MWHCFPFISILFLCHFVQGWGCSSLGGVKSWTLVSSISHIQVVVFPSLSICCSLEAISLTIPQHLNFLRTVFKHQSNVYLSFGDLAGRWSFLNSL